MTTDNTRATDRTRTIVLYTFTVGGRPVLILPVGYDGTLTDLPAHRVQLRAVKTVWKEWLVDSVHPDETADWLPAEAAKALWHAWDKPYSDRVGIRLARADEVRDWETGREAFLTHKQEHPDKFPTDADGWDGWDGYNTVVWLKRCWCEVGAAPGSARLAGDAPAKPQPMRRPRG